MAEDKHEDRRKTVKVGVKEGGGVAPGYLWNVDILNQAFDQAMGFLNEDQYAHLSSQVRELARQEDPTRSDSVDVRALEDFHEIRDKGGFLARSMRESSTSITNRLEPS
jgi:hypothetical protein